MNNHENYMTRYLSQFAENYEGEAEALKEYFSLYERLCSDIAWLTSHLENDNSIRAEYTGDDDMSKPKPMKDDERKECQSNLKKLEYAKSKVAEYISDEQAHGIGWAGMIAMFSKIAPAQDGLAESVAQIVATEPKEVGDDD